MKKIMINLSNNIFIYKNTNIQKMLKLLCLIVVTLNITEFAVCLTNLLASRRYCGYQHTDDYERKSSGISIDEFPWLAQLLYDEDKSIRCTGSLINSRYVLTAAHCLITPLTEVTAIRLGDYDVTRDKDCVKDSNIGEECSDPVVEFNIEEKIVHPHYVRKSGLNDIALVRLSRTVEYSEYIRPICLPLTKDLELSENQDLAVSGWGLLTLLGETTPIKKKILTKLIPYEKCKEVYLNYSKTVTPFHLCGTESETYTCQGDSGGPLMTSIKNQWEQVGILSFGKYCGSMFPSVYINTAKYLDWIIQNLKE